MFHKQQKLIFSVVMAISFIVACISCKKDPDTQPTPQSTTVLISGKEYSTVTIGNQIWTTTNYKGPGGLPYRKGNEKPEYGHYYTFDEAKAVVVPTGWRLPTREDYTALAESQGVVFTAHRATGQAAISKLTSTTNWRTIPGTNTSGFNAHPAGYSYQDNDPLDGDICEFWTADGTTCSIQENATGKAHNIVFYSNGGPGYRFNLRFLRNR
ncbi:hypothetical protein IC229_16065 [Spirosoma sp. BT702]|uniref:Fibrobacter succinogenes major paralogous domain-containing protein n=1 Tax=Spirosoma profusum TaxID=2771354 RepID=A0A926Y209_9BACT|nr:FISUMP domain-containing protein [Spirosoma profusum]MBD2702168.1 hypothetical protein [Spirosoma profusum]